ncbi:MAG: hypothetical protein WC101_05730, partial [Candidatus Gracilibacteria bacterium]
PMGGQMGGYQPQGGGFPPMPPAGQAGGFPPAPPMPPVEDETPANFRLGEKLPAVLKVQIPAHNLSFDEQYFLHMLAGSISLTRDEKKKIVESVPKLKQSQVDELIRIFEEEREKFAQLSKKHIDQLEKLAQKHFEEWMDLESEFAQQNKAQEDAAKAEEIRKQLGL